MHSLCSCKVIVHFLILEGKRELQLTRLVFSLVVSFIKKKQFEGHTRKVNSWLQQRPGCTFPQISKMLCFPMCSYYRVSINATFHFSSSVMFLVIAGIGCQKAQSRPAFLSVVNSFSIYILQQENNCIQPQGWCLILCRYIVLLV